MAGYLNSKMEDTDIGMHILQPKLTKHSIVTMETESNKTLLNCFQLASF